MHDADTSHPTLSNSGAAGLPSPPAPPMSSSTSPDPEPSSPRADDQSGPASVRPELRNWAVLDEHAPTIEGTARILEDLPEPEADDGETGNLQSQALPPDDGSVGSDQIDPVLIAGLPHRELHVQPGGKATLVVSLLNNGPVAAPFEVHLEGWVHESWVEGEHKKRLLVQPGQRAALPIVVAPPRNGSVRAGSFPIIVVVRSPRYPQQRTRLVATLVIEPFTELVLGKLEPTSAALGTFRRVGHFVLPVSNLSNHPLRVSLQGYLLGLRGRVDFTDALAEANGKGPRWLMSPATLNLAPQQAIELYVRASVQGGPLLAAQPMRAALRVTASPEGARRLPRAATADLVYRPALRPWHLMAAVAASFVILAGAGLLALAAQMLLTRSVATDPAPASIERAAPPIVIVLNQTAPVSPQQTHTVPLAAPAPDAGAALQSPAPAASNGVPIVQASQVTAPGAPPPPADAQAPTVGFVTAQSVSQPGQAVLPLPAASDNGSSEAARQMTYAELFQEIALQYDLDWRLLAAQAYIESSFDSLALGNDGDMGLMQVLPSTWREWAPVVSASDPFDAYSNVLVAAVYHNYLRSELGKRGVPQAQWMLVAYNWGIDRLGKFLDEGGTWEQLPAIRRGYAEDILRIARTIP